MYPELADKPVKPRAESPVKPERAASPFPTIPDVTDLQPDEILKCDRDLRINRPVSPFPQEKTDNPELMAINMNKVYENTEDIEKKFESLCKITDSKSIREQSKHMEFNNFNTVPCPFSSLRLKFCGTKPSNITKALPISLDEQLNKEVASTVLENTATFDSLTNVSSVDNFKSSIEMNSSAEIKQTERLEPMKFPSRPVSPYPVYIPISRTATPIPSRQEVLDPPAIKPIETDQEQTAVKNNDIEIKEKESSVSSQHINQAENVRSVCQEIQVAADSSEITCSKPPEAVIGARPIFGQLDINNELRKAFGLVKQTPVKESQKRQTVQQAENKSLSERRDSAPINQTVSEQVTEVKFDKRETQETVQRTSERKVDEIKQEQVSNEQMMIDASFDALVQDNSFENNLNGTDESEYQPQPIKSLIKTFEESTMPVMKYKQIREPSSDIVMSLSMQSNGTKTHNSVEINKSEIEETKQSSNTMSNLQQMSYSDVSAQESIDTNTEPVSNGADNNMFYVASARVQTRSYLPTAAVESVSSQQSSESFVEQESEMFKKSTEFQSSEQIIQSSSSSSSFQASSSSQNSSFIQVQQSGGQQFEGKMAVFSFVFWFLCVFPYIFVGENSTVRNNV